METLVSLFADDTATWRRDGKIKGSDRVLMQHEIDKVIQWADKWKMRINVDKTRIMVTSSSAEDQKWNPQLEAMGKEIKPVQDYKFLGNNIDNDLRFRSHVDSIFEKGNNRNKILKCMSTKTWGNQLETQKGLYIQYCRSTLEYASSSWAPWISDTNRKRIQRVQNTALRSVAGLSKTCPQDFLQVWNRSKTD